MENYDFVLKGADFHESVSEDSIGLRIYNNLKYCDPNKVLFVDNDTNVEITAGELFKNTCKLSKALANLGCKKGDIIGISSENRLEYFQPVIASLYLGLVVAPISHHYTQYELMHVVDICKPKIIFCTKLNFQKYISLQDKLTYLEKIVVFDSNVMLESGLECYENFIKKISYENFTPISLNTYEDLAVILCSSGTTGLPKGVMITHRNMNVNFTNLSDPNLFKIVPNAVFLGLLPFYHGFGFHMAINNILRQEKIVVMKKFKDVAFLSAIEKYKITNLWLVPPLIIFLAKSPLVENFDLTSIVEIICAAAPLGKETQSQILERLKLERVVQGYGMTETTFAVSIIPLKNKVAVDGSCGKIINGMSAKITNPETGASLKSNEIGELCFKGDLIMKGYYNAEQMTKLTIDANGWLKTGDIGYYDDNGYFYIVDRLKELIKYKGIQVAPAEVEALLVSHDKIVVGLKDIESGELPVAFVVSDGTISEDEVKAHVADHLSRPKYLHGGVRFVNEIPRAASGKILRRILKQQLL